MAFAERKPRSTEAAVRALMQRQLGLATSQQLAHVGMSSASITRRLRAGRWDRVLPGVVRDVMAPSNAAQAALAAILWGGEGALVSHHTAASAWALDGVGAAKPEIWVPTARRLRSELVVVHRGEVGAVDRRMVGPVPVTSPARTLIDLASVLDDEDLATAVEDAIHRGLTTPQSILRRLDALGGTGRAGSARLRAILDDRGSQAAAESRLEVRIWRTLRRAGLRPVRQHRVRVGDRSYRVDCAFPQQRLAVEGIGDRFHRALRERSRERRRLADLASVWWRVLPVTWPEITEAPDAVVANVVRALADAA